MNLHADLVSGVFPGQREFDKLLGQLPSYPHPSIAVVDSLVLLGDYDDEDTIQQPELDLFGYSSYARIVSSLLLHFLDNRDAARENVWALRHFQALALYAKDVLQVPSAQSAVFGRDVDRADLDDLISKVDQLSAYTLTHLVDDGWFSRIIPLLSAGKAAPSSDRIALLLESLLQPRDGDSVRESRILHSILRHVLAGVTKADADQLIVLARSIEKKGEPLRPVKTKEKHRTDRNYSSPGFSCRSVLRNTVCPGASSAGQAAKRVGGGNYGCASCQSEHRRPLDAASSGGCGARSGVGHCVFAYAACCELDEGVSAMDRVRRGPR